MRNAAGYNLRRESARAVRVYWLALAVVAAGALAPTTHAQEWRYLNITAELVEQRWQYHDEDTDLLMLELTVTNNENRFLYGDDISLDVVITDELDDRTYPTTYWTGGPMAESCPEDVESVASGRTGTWNVCFKVPAGEKPDFLRIYDRPVSQIIQFRAYSASCQDTYGDLCAPHTLDGGISAEEYLATCPDVSDFSLEDVRFIIECWSDGFAILLDYVLYLEELVDDLTYERDILQPAVHRTYDSKDNYDRDTVGVLRYLVGPARLRVRGRSGREPCQIHTHGA